MELDGGPLSVALARIAGARGAGEHRGQDEERDHGIYKLGHDCNLLLARGLKASLPTCADFIPLHLKISGTTLV
jgi:hypothetical protein